MPRYDFACQKCNKVVEEIRPMSACIDPGKCQKCGGKTERVISGDVCIILVG